MNLEEVLTLVDGERRYQEDRWRGHVHSPGAYLTYMTFYQRRMETVDSTVDQSSSEHNVARDAMRKFAALGVSCIEQNGLVDNEPSSWEEPAPVRRDHIYAVLQRDTWRLFPDLENVPQFSEFLTILRHSLRLADEAWTCNSRGTQRKRETLNYVRLMAACAIRCLMAFDAPAR
jgi:hypothetical protein